MVIKFGGNAMVDDALAHSFAADIVLLRAVGLRLVVVHGGGPQIGELLAKLGKESEFKDGLRVTDAETLDVARMVLTGQVNADIVSAINQRDQVAVGLSGEDAGLIIAEQRSAALGYVGDVVNVNRKILDTLLDADFIPVISTIGTDHHGQAFNINADIGRHRHRRQARCREADLPHRRARRAHRRGRSGEPRLPALHGSGPGPDRRRRHQRRDDPQGRGLPRRDRRPAWVRPTSSTGASPTWCCSNC